MPSRRRLWSSWAKIALRDKPSPFGPACMRPRTFVAITSSSRSPQLGEQPSGDLLARAVGVHVGGVEEVDPRLDRLAEERAAGVFIDRPRVSAATRAPRSSCTRGRSLTPACRSSRASRTPSLDGPTPAACVVRWASAAAKRRRRAREARRAAWLRAETEHHQIRRRSLAQAVSWWRLESCSLRSTAETCDSIVFTERWRRWATSL